MSRRSIFFAGVLVVLCAFVMQTNVLAGIDKKELREPVKVPQSQFGITVDVETGEVTLIQPDYVMSRDGKTNLDNAFVLTFANCIDCGAPFEPPYIRTIVATLQATQPVARGFGLSNTRITNYSILKVDQTETCDLLTNDFVTFTFTGVLSVFTRFSIYFSVCDTPPGDLTAPCLSLPAGGVFSGDPIVGNVRLVPGSCFLQGSDSAEICREQDGGLSETQSLNTLLLTTAMMETEVTRGMWAALLAAMPTLPADPSNTTVSPTANHPVQQVTWPQALLFANLLSSQNGFTACYYTDAGFTTPITSANYLVGPYFCDFTATGYRLPSEGEWEYAARALTTGAFYVDEALYTEKNCNSCSSGTHTTLEQNAVYCANSAGGPAVVGSKLANNWNFEDMMGNVAEWCFEQNARGGSWNQDARMLRSADRRAYAPGTVSTLLGFRLVRTVY